MLAAEKVDKPAYRPQGEGWDTINFRYNEKITNQERILESNRNSTILRVEAKNEEK